MRIFLADLGHNLLTRSSDVYPLGVANLAAYATAYLRTSSALEIAVFREPQDLKAALDAQPPDILGLSNYAWNQELAASFASYTKRQAPATVTVMGGPNYPLTEPVQESFLRSLPQIDAYVDGPTYEGEVAFLNLAQRFIDARHAEGVFEEPIAGISWIDRRTGAFIKAGHVERIKDLDEIPSPYLAGWMEPYLSTGYFPILQIARGCPFSCAFCNSGVASNSRIRAHSVQNVKDDLTYLATRIRPEITLCFADDNFGMYARDEEIADFIGWLQDRYSWPRYIRTTTGKNNSERIIRVMRKARGTLPMTAAVQSMNREVLKNIRRDNIKLETYRLIQQELERQGMQSYGELILCLPGETKASFMKAVEDLLDAGAKRISAHQLMLLHGAELANPDERARHGFDTRFRVVARNIGDYTGEPIIETEEMVVATPTFSYRDYLDTRLFHLLLTIYYYEGNYEEAFEYARHHGIRPYDLIVTLQSMVESAPAEFRAVLDHFLQESEEELFPTRESCSVWAREHYHELVDGTKGGNLLSKYSMLGRFFAMEASLGFLEAGIAASLAERHTGQAASEVRSLMSYLRAVLLHAPLHESIHRQESWTSGYDVHGWVAEHFAKPLSAYPLPGPTTFTAAMEPAKRTLLETKLATFGDHPSGLGKFTRTMFARDLRRTLIQTPGLVHDVRSA